VQIHWSAALDPYPTKPRNVFRPDGTFKLTVFSDLHFGENPWDDWGPVQDIKSIALMKTVLNDEKPDYVYDFCVNSAMCMSLENPSQSL
jgi:hypothetical protein